VSEPQYVRATTVAQAVEALQAAGGDGLVVAGGIVVGSLVNQRLAAPSILVDITRIEAMRGIARSAGTLTIGALATHDDVLKSADVRAATPLLAEIAAEVSCPRLRNRGTLGGSICTIGGQGDPATGLIALGATIRICGPGGTRTAAIEDFYKNAFEVDLVPDEIVEFVSVPVTPPGTAFGFSKLAPRNAMDWTQITTSVVFRSESGWYRDVRIGMNGVANTPSRPRATEQLLSTMTAGAVDWTAVGKTINSEISPTGDLVYSEDFKRHLAVVSLRRALERASTRR
jgi:carbon-monoxide dehydrogenase medium subunit